VKQTEHPSSAIMRLDPAVAARMVMASADIAVIMDAQGLVKDVLLAAEARLPSEFGGWLGRSWLETIAMDSRAKAQQLIADAAAGLQGRMREINHVAAAGGATVPIRYSAVRLADTGDVLAIGRDLRALAALQQQLVQFQQTMEREYGRLRAADTRYRVLFQLTNEPTLIVDAGSRRIVEANPAALALLGVAQPRAAGRALGQLFADRGGDQLQNLLALAATGGATQPAKLKLADRGVEVSVAATLFRQDGVALLLVQMTADPAGKLTMAQAMSDASADLLNRLPEAVVMTDQDGIIMTANGAFLDLTGLASPAQAQGQPIDQWLGRAGVDFGVLKAALRDKGVVSRFATVMRSAYGALENIEIAASSDVGPSPRHLFILRPVGRPALDASGAPAIPRSAEHFKQLIGRVPLRELVRETTDIIEKLVIEAALDITSDNKASAAELLGLSRQGLYAKLHRFGIGDISVASED
jgi:transcriptional regulator PpsR